MEVYNCLPLKDICNMTDEPTDRASNKEVKLSINAKWLSTVYLKDLSYIDDFFKRKFVTISSTKLVYGND